MKVKFTLLAVAMLVLSINSYAQFTFGVSPGLSFNSAYFGYRTNGNFVLFGGLQYASANYEFDNKRTTYDPYTDESNTTDYDGSLKGKLIVPNLGVKFFIIEQNKLQGYLSANIAKPFVSGKMSSENEDAEDAFEEQIKGLSLWGGELGFGVEYFFDDNFSLGGEFGLRHFRVKSEYKYEDEDEYSGYTNEFDDELKLIINPTYSRVSLNFYF